MSNKPLRGRPKRYTSSTGTPSPPTTGWETPRIDTPAGRLLIRLINEERVQPRDQPADIWSSFPELQVVNPDYFGRFVRACRKEVERRLIIESSIHPPSPSPLPSVMPAPYSIGSVYDDESISLVRPTPSDAPSGSKKKKYSKLKQEYKARDPMVDLPLRVLKGTCSSV